MYQIGKIVNTHGIKGEVHIYNLSDFNRFSTGETIYVELKDKSLIPLIMDHVRPHKNVLIVKFNGIDNINDVLQYKGLFVYSQEKNEEIEDDEFYFDELVEKEVYLENGEKVGFVISVIEVPQGHLLEIETKTKKALIPFRKEFVVDVSDTIVVKNIEGLL
jgi:16S rRNA processing protein RimM